MSRAYGTFWISGLLAMSLAVTASHAQSGTPASLPAPDSATPAPDSAPEEGKKKGGLFGKAKKFVGNKAVQQVAKTVACNMVPGGQVVAGAIDAASSKDVGDAAAGAAGAATGQTCMPGGLAGMAAGAGVPGAGAVPGGAPGELGMAGLAGAAGGAAGLAGGIGAAGLGGLMGGGAMPGGMPGAEMGSASMSAMPGHEGIAACMGLTGEEFLDFTDPTRGEARSPTRAEMDRHNRVAKKVDMGRYQSCMTQAMAQFRAPGAAPAGGAGDDAATEDAVADGKLSEAPGKSVGLSSDLAADLKKGKTVVKDIDWLAGGGELAEGGKASFADAMSELAAAMQKAGGAYRADIYLDKRYQDVAVQALGPARLKLVLSSLEKAGLASDVATAGKVKKDKHPRLEIVKAKK
jgi:hypothetical protein